MLSSSAGSVLGYQQQQTGLWVGIILLNGGDIKCRQLFVHGVTNSNKLLDLLKVSLLAVFCNKKTNAPQDLRRPAQGKGICWVGWM